eukprot:TRINITY_DN14065_c0_g1_i4.p2 TRINITY_DN14065_c0_g1~~TRINITY_DN14065_c0_g1_i4.p2  ORF type:complete len:165 (-),score=14.45 TRINITY_DN14065_c0_g1_i4:1526-2020(-)
MGFMDSFRRTFSLQEEEDPSLITQIQTATTLTWTQRLWGFGICFAVGMLFTIISIWFVFVLNFKGFGVFYTLGSIATIASTFFLMGPLKQFKRMFKYNRWIASLVYVGSIILTLVVAFAMKNSGFLVLILVVIQFCAMIWYILTYVPGGQAMLGRCFGLSFDGE